MKLRALVLALIRELRASNTPLTPKAHTLMQEIERKARGRDSPGTIHFRRLQNDDVQ